MSEDIRNSGIMIFVIFLVGMVGVVFLFWARNYTRSRKLLQDTRAFASETIGNLPMGIVVVNEKSKINFINDVLAGTRLKTIGSYCEKTAAIFLDAVMEAALQNVGLFGKRKLVGNFEPEI